MAAVPTVSFRKTLLLMTTSSFIAPLGGLVTAPILARALGADGRGELAAAVAPASLLLGVATLGLPDALTFVLAKRPSSTFRLTLWSCVLTALLGCALLVITWIFSSFLAGGDPTLAQLIVLGTAITVPALVVGVVRGAAVGLQMYRAVAVERLINTGSRVVVFVILWLTGDLTPLAAVVVSCSSPIIAGLAYLGMRQQVTSASLPGNGGNSTDSTMAGLIRYGLNVWFGSIAALLMARLGGLFIVPLSTPEDLGYYVVAVTISDLPLLVAFAVQGALFGLNSKEADAAKLAAVSRLTLIPGVVGCVVLGLSLPLWLAPLFGREFDDAVVPTQILIAAAAVSLPGLVCAASLPAWGRPGLRSWGLVLTLAVNTATFLLLVPTAGVYGACIASLIGALTMSIFMLVAASRTIGLPIGDFLRVRRRDVARLIWEARQLMRARRGTPVQTEGAGQ